MSRRNDVPAHILEDVKLAVDQAFLQNGRVSITPDLLRDLIEAFEIEDEEAQTALSEAEEERDVLEKGFNEADEKLDTLKSALTTLLAAAEEIMAAKGWDALKTGKTTLAEAITEAKKALE